MTARLSAGLALAALAIASPALAAEPDACCSPVSAAAPAPDVLAPVTLTDQRGQAVSMPDGRIWIVTFFFGHCQEACPALLSNMRAVSEALPAAVRRQVAFGAVSFDPARDDVAALATHAEHYGFNGPGEHLLTGEASAIARATHAFRFDFKANDRGGFQHTNLLAVMDGRGRVTHHFYGLRPNIARIAQVVTTQVASPQAGR